MKISKEKMATNRASLIASASRLFQEQGFDGTGVAQISEEAGLTQGGFYGQFKSKASLAEAACRQSLASGRDAWLAMKGTTDSDMGAFMDAYVSLAHVDDVADGCPMAAYAGEIRRQDTMVQDTFVDGFKGMIEMLQEALCEQLPIESARSNALFIMAAMMGSVVMARAIGASDPTMSQEIIVASRQCLKDLADCDPSSAC